MRKRRTREHIIADLGVHHVEGVVLERGWTAESVTHDYGYDLAIFTYTEEGFLEPGMVLAQVKATGNLEDQNNTDFLSWTLDVRDIRTWKSELMPVVFIVYDVSERVAYWIGIQDLFSDRDIPGERIYTRCRIPRKNRWDAESLTFLGERKRDRLNRMKEK